MMLSAAVCSLQSSGKSLAQAGPAPLFIGYTLVGFLCFLVMAALGEVNSVSPILEDIYLAIQNA
jgi:amino acid permease